MEWLFETPWPAVSIGLLVVALLGVVFFNTRQAALLWAMAAVAVVAIVLVLVEWLVVTDREAVAQTLESAARALEQNDEQELLARLDPQAQELRALARAALRAFDFQTINIGGDLDVRFYPATSPPTAEARFTARVSAKSRGPQLPRENLVRPVKITLRERDGQWLIWDYEGEDFQRRLD